MWEKLADFIERAGWRNYEKFDAYCAITRFEDGSRYIYEPLFSQELMKILGERGSYLISSPSSVYRMFRRIFEVGGRVNFASTYCGAMKSQFVFDPYGEIYACWDSTGCAIGKIGRYDPKLEFDESFYQWRNRMIANIPQCLACPYALLCKGGCAQFAYYATGSIYSPFCDGYPASFEYQVKKAYRDFRIEQTRRAAIAQEGLSLPILAI